MEVVFLLSAERDLQEAYNWVEEHRQGREQFFLQDVGLSLEHLRGFPLIGRLYRGANQDAIASGGRIGIQRGGVVSATATPMGYHSVGEAVSFATAGVAGGQNVDSLNVQKHYDATLEEEEQKRKKK